MKDKLKAAIDSQLAGLPCRKQVTLLRDLVELTTVHSLGDGEWSIELHTGSDEWSPVIAEFVGNNGTREGDQTDDLWKEVDNWRVDPLRGGSIACRLSIYTLPDRRALPYHQIIKEVSKGRLHGLTLSF